MTVTVTVTVTMGSREEMYSKFQPWVLATYGDSAKTKTITIKKAERIRTLLLEEKEGSEPAGSEAAKLRVWVRSKGLQLGREGEGRGELYVPTGTDKVRVASKGLLMGSRDVIMFKKSDNLLLLMSL